MNDERLLMSTSTLGRSDSGNIMQNIIYEYGDSLYINLTNRCSNDCTFCIRNFRDGVGNDPLWLEHEPTAAEVIAALGEKDLGKYGEVVFCGFGEPTCAFEVLLEVAEYLKKHGAVTRINTNGQSDLYNNTDDSARRLAPFIDEVSISLNASTAEKYDAVCRCAFGEQGFYAMLDFARDCVREGIDTVMSVVDCIGAEEIEACRKVAESVGARLRVRAMIEDGD